MEKHAHPPRVVYCAIYLTLSTRETIPLHYFPLREDSPRVLASTLLICVNLGNEKREARDTTSVGTGAIISPDRERQHGEKDTVILESKDRKDCNNNEPKSEVRVDNVGKGKVSSMELLFSVKEAETMVQTVSVSRDGEELFTSTSRNTGPRFGDLKCTFEDLFGPGEVKLQEINVETRKGCLKINIDKNA